jgi:hypothetical protein
VGKVAQKCAIQIVHLSHYLLDQQASQALNLPANCGFKPENTGGTKTKTSVGKRTGTFDNQAQGLRIAAWTHAPPGAERPI